MLNAGGGPTQHGNSYFDGLDLDHRIIERWRPITDRDVPDADIVVATWWETAEWASNFSASKGKKVHFIQHHEMFPYLPLDRVSATYRLPLHKIVISGWLKELMATEYGDLSVDLIPNSVDTTQFFASKRGRQNVPTLGLLYSTVGFKGVDITLKSIERVKQSLGRTKVVAFGSEPISATLPLPEDSDFHFCPEQKEIRHIYESCDVWVCGSRSEGFHLPPLEAMACRCPVVSTRVGGPADIIENGSNGFLVDVDDWVNLADTVVELLKKDEKSWIRMSDAAHRTAMSYSWDNATDLLEQTLHRILSS